MKSKLKEKKDNKLSGKSSDMKSFGKDTLKMARTAIGTTLALGVMKSVKDAFQ